MRRHEWLLAVALVALFVGLTAQSQPPKPTGAEREGGPPQEQPAGDNDNPNTYQRGTEQAPVVVRIDPAEDAEQRAAEDRAERQDEATARWANVYLTGFLVIVALGTGIIVGWQAWETRRSVVFATSARVYVDGVDVVNFEAGKEPVFFLNIRNAGPVQAERVGVFLEVTHVHGGTKPAQSNAVTIPANGLREYDFRANFALPNDLGELENWNLTLKGTVTYNKSEIPICYKYSHWFGERPVGVPLFVPCDFDQRRNVTIKISGVSARGSTGTLTAKSEGAEAADGRKTDESKPDGKS